MKQFVLYLLLITGTGWGNALGSCRKPAPASRAIPGTTRPDNNSPIPVDTTQTIRFLALGDSYTIGQSVATSLRFPAQTTAWLRNKGINVQAPEYIATTGWTTVNLQSAIQSVHPQGTYQLVTLLIGVNDQYQGSDTASYRHGFTQLLQKSIELAGGNRSRVFVLSIPDYSVTPFASGSNREQISTAIDAFNSINKQVTAQYHCNYLNITTSTREAVNDRSLIADDGLHPSGIEYRKWASWLGSLMLASLQ